MPVLRAVLRLDHSRDSFTFTRQSAALCIQSCSAWADELGSDDRAAAPSVSVPSIQSAHSRMKRRMDSLRLSIACCGLGHIQRGYESFTRECFEALPPPPRAGCDSL